MKVTNVIRLMRLALLIIIAVFLQQGMASVSSRAALAPLKTPAEIPSGKPNATIDLATPDGVSAVKGEGAYAEPKIFEEDFRGLEAEKNPTGPPCSTLAKTPK